MEEFPYYAEAAYKHPEVKEEWVARVLEDPYHVAMQSNGRMRYYGYVPEAGKWLRVIVENGKLLNRFFDRGKLKEWGRL